MSLGYIGNHLRQRSAASTERYSHLSGEETLETGAPQLLRGCMGNSDKFADKWNFQKPNIRKPFQMLVGRRGLEPRIT